MPLATFLSTPPLVRGTPVFLAIELFIPLIPTNLLSEKDTPSFLPNPNIIYNLIPASLNFDLADVL